LVKFTVSTLGEFLLLKGTFVNVKKWPVTYMYRTVMDHTPLLFYLDTIVLR